MTLLLLKLRSAIDAPPIIDSFTSSGTTLYWQTTNATTASISYIGSVAVDGSNSPSNPFDCNGGTRSYTLTASGNGISVTATTSIYFANYSCPTAEEICRANGGNWFAGFGCF